MDFSMVALHSMINPTAPQVSQKENLPSEDPAATKMTGSPTRHQTSVSSKQTAPQTTLKITDLKDFNKLTSSNNTVRVRKGVEFS